MRLARVLGAVGRILITAGTLILLFVVYQLWGTGIRTAQAQNRLEDEFEQKIEEFESSTTTTERDDGPTTTTDPEKPANGPDEAIDQEVPIPPDGESIAHIRIPAIDVDWIVVQGVGLEYLQDGPGHYVETPMPGQEGNVAIAGHRTTYGAPFHRLDELQEGDHIFIDTWYGKWRYDVLQAEGADAAHLIVTPDQTEVLADFGDNRLTLTACHPKYSAAQRIVVVAKMFEGEGAQKALPAPKLTPEQQKKRERALEQDIGETDAARWPAIAWFLACAAIWIAAWLIGRWWGHKWPAYFIGLPFFLVALFFFFEEFSRLLPADY